MSLEGTNTTAKNQERTIESEDKGRATLDLTTSFFSMLPTRLLDNYYTTVVTLLEYLFRATKRHADAFIRENDDESFKTLLQTTLVAFDCPLADIPHLEPHQSMMSQTDVSRFG